MRKSLAVLLVTLMISPGAFGASRTSAAKQADAAYEAARHSYYVLKDDAQRRKYRHNWLNVVERFDQVAQKFPISDRAPQALFTAAQLLGDLSRISMLDEDLRGAVERYQRLLDKYSRSTLSDDAALALATIYTERTGETDKARKVLDLALKRLPNGDMRRKLAAVEKTLPSTPAVPAKGKRIAAREEPVSVALADEPRPEPKAEAKSEDSAPPLAEAFARASRDEAKPEPKPEPKAAPAKPAPQPEPLARVEAPPAKVEVAAPERQPEAQARRLPVADVKEAKARLRAAVKAGGDEITLAEQLGLKVRRVVIDAGHGGHDTGAVGKKGTREKDVTLAIAKRVGEILADQGLEVILTRDDDTYIRLEDRTRIANEAKGDLFISIHCNAAESRKVHGIETFTLNVAADRYSIRLAARENSASEKSISDLQFILADLATKANTEESERLARRVQSSLVTDLSREHKRVADLGTKQALFYVLLGAKMPAILVETAFLSHPEEEERLSSKAYQEDAARAIAHGVQGFLEDRNRLAAKVD